MTTIRTASLALALAVLAGCTSTPARLAAADTPSCAAPAYRALPICNAGGTGTP